MRGTSVSVPEVRCNPRKYVQNSKDHVAIGE